MFKYIISRLGEASTWRGVIALVTGSLGYSLSVDQGTALVTLGVAMVGAVGAFFPDKLGR